MLLKIDCSCLLSSTALKVENMTYTSEMLGRLSVCNYFFMGTLETKKFEAQESKLLKKSCTNFALENR